MQGLLSRLLALAMLAAVLYTSSFALEMFEEIKPYQAVMILTRAS